jgi:hypothetical protein
MPAECQRTGALCYANLAGQRYEFAAVASELAGVAALRRDAVWPAETVPHVRNLYDAWDWRGAISAAGPLTIVRQATNVSLESIGSDDRFILVLRNAGAGAVVRLRPPGPLHGVLVDARTGQTLRAERYDGAPDGLMNVELPPGFDILLLAMRADPAR